MSVYLRSASPPHLVGTLLILVDAVPKKRGPKTDVLEALLKRVDGLEKRLQEDSPISPTSATSPIKSLEQHLLPSASTAFQLPPPSHSFPPPPPQPQPRLPDAMLDAYFARLHGKPYWILDETATRQRHQHGQLPAHLSMAIYALTLRSVSLRALRAALTAADIPRRILPRGASSMLARRDG